MRGTRTSVAVAALGLCLAGTAACGGGGDEAFKGQSADQIAAKAVEATRQAESMHMKGTVVQSGGQKVGIDLAVDSQKNCQGTVTNAQAVSDIRHKDATLYVKGNSAYWQASLKQQPQSEKMVPKVADKWVRVPADDDQLTGLCDKQGLLASMDEDKSERQGMSRGDTTTIDGKKAVELKKQKDGATQSMFVAADGKPYVLKVTTTGTKAETTVFTDYNKPVDPPQPPADQTVDLKQLAAQK
ncbi:hypothetical protein ACGFW5_20405 [Streptomyces sp. NPDC048416]|uniref:hypothetical protein n=1 Tax=Streptomyces sp. NPDC048416 TaxID=3365546 RepID=UPI00371E407A